MAYRNYGEAVARIVDGATGGIADFTTIAAALTAASSGQTIFIRPGTYTENLSLKSGVNLTAWSTDQTNNTVWIKGKMSYSSAGTVILSNLFLGTNGDYLLSVTGSVGSKVYLQNCYLYAVDFTAIQHTSSSAASRINLYNCDGNLLTTGISMWSSTSPGTIQLRYCIFSNTGASTTASNVSAGSITGYYSHVDFPISTSSTGSVSLERCTVYCSGLNTTALAHAGTGSNCAVQYGYFAGGSAEAITVGAGATLGVYECIVDSTHTAAITGSGTIIYSSHAMTASNTDCTVTTQTAAVNRFGVQRSSKQPCVSAYKSSDSSNATGDGTVVTVVFDTEITDQGSNYNNGTGTFTAPYTGMYLVCGSVGLNNIGAPTTSNVKIVATSRTFQGNSWNPSNVKSNGNQADHLFSAIVDMTAGDTFTIQVVASGSTKITTVQGNTVMTTYLGVYLLC